MAVMQLKDKITNKPIKDKKGKSWYFKTYYTSLSGERKQYKSKKYLSKHEAEDAERLFLMEKSNKLENNHITFKDLLNSYEKYQKEKVKITTIIEYKKFYKYIEPLYNIIVSEFSINQFNLWKEEINNKDLSTTYKNNIYKFLKALINHASFIYDIDIHTTSNKMSGFKNPNEFKKEMLFWTYDEFSKFINQDIKLKYKVYFETLYYCGFRKGEANALTWNDIDLEKGLININKSLTLKIKGKEYVILPPKTKSSIRTLPISKTLLSELKLLFSEWCNYSNFNKEWFVFGGPIPLKDTTVQNYMIKNCKLANIKKIRIHDFRHSCASLLISNGASVSLVSKYLGHSNITTTLNTYTHMFKNEMTDIINIIDKINNN